MARLSELEQAAVDTAGAYYRPAEWRETGYNSHIPHYRVNRHWRDIHGKASRQAVADFMRTREHAQRIADMHNRKTAEIGRWSA